MNRNKKPQTPNLSHPLMFGDDPILEPGRISRSRQEAMQKWSQDLNFHKLSIMG